MSDWQAETRADYEQKGFASRSGFGSRPALLVIDFIYGFTDPTTPLGGDFAGELKVTQDLLAAFRARDLPVAFTTVAYNDDLSDGGVFVEKVPSLGILRRGSKMCDVDDRIRPAAGELVAEKQYASAFFGTEIDSWLRLRGADTTVIVGCTTSGCVRATAVDSLQYGYRTIVVSDGVGDRAQGPHEANLFDIDAKYGDVIASAEVLAGLQALARSEGLAETANADFQRWWSAGRPAAGG